MLIHVRISNVQFIINQFININKLISIRHVISECNNLNIIFRVFSGALPFIMRFTDKIKIIHNMMWKTFKGIFELDLNMFV